MLFLTKQNNGGIMIDHDAIQKMDIEQMRDYVGMPKHIQMKINQFRGGYFDGRNSAMMNNPFHENWKDGRHIEESYLLGYWTGYDDSIGRERNVHWPALDLINNGSE